MTSYSNDIQKMYIAYFGRPADVGGLSYWTDQIVGAEGSPEAVINAFTASTEYHDAYTGKTNEFIVDSIYQNLFGRAAETDGVTYWAGKLANGTFNVGNIAWAIMTGAQNDDFAVLANKATVAQLFTETGYSGIGNENVQALNILKIVTADAASIVNAEALIDGTAILSGAVMGYTNGATVFLDSNFNSKLDAGEASTTANATGGYTLAGGIGQLVAIDGIDVTTNSVNKAVFTATMGSTIISPISTLIAQKVADGSSIAVAQATIKSALGITSDVNLSTLNPLTVIGSTTATDAEKMVALKLQAANVQINNVFSSAVSALVGAGETMDPVKLATATATASARIVTSFTEAAVAGTTVNLSDAAFIKSVLEEVAGTASNMAITVSMYTNAQSIANILAENNARIDAQVANATPSTMGAVIGTIGRIQEVIQDGLAAALVGGFTNISSIVSSYTGAAADSLIANATIGIIDASIVIPVVTPPPSGGGSPAVSSYVLTASAPIVTEIMVGAATTKAMIFTLTLGSVPTEVVTVDYATQTSGTATSGADFVAATGTVTFAVGQTVANVTIVINNDATAEGDETVPVLFSGSKLAASVTGTGTILANDTVGLTVVLTAGTDTPVLGANDDTINTNGANQLSSADIVAAGLGYDTLSITTTPDEAFTLDDAIFTNVSGVDKIIILTSGTGAQTITTGAEFNGAFGSAGADLQTTSTTGAQTINMSAVTGPATLTSISDASVAGNSITMGAGATTVTAITTTGAMTINSAASAVATVTVTTSTGAVSVTTGAGADFITLSTGDTAGNTIVAGAGNDTIVATAVTATTDGTTFTGGWGADTINITGNTSKDTIVIGNSDSGITLATADRITGFSAADDELKMGAPGTDNVNYVEGGVIVADFAAALVAANLALNGTVLYSFQWDGTNGYLFEDTGVDGIANQVVVLVGIDNNEIAFGNIIA